LEQQKPPQTYTRAEQLSLRVELTDNDQAFIAEWAASVPALFFLDINAVQATKLSQDQLNKNKRKARLVEYLQFLDRPQHGISYLFSLMEKVSDSRGEISDAQLEKQVLEDAAALRDFFEHAKIYESDKFLTSYLRSLRRVPVEIQRPNYLAFLEAVNLSLGLHQSVSKPRRFKWARQVVEIAQSSGVYHQHPIVSLVLASLYGNKAAKKLLKFTRDPSQYDSENALADVMTITRFANHKLKIDSTLRLGAKYMRTDFVTDDEGLRGVIGCFQPQKMTIQETDEGSTTHYTFTVQLEKLLTEIDAVEYQRVYDLLAAPPTGEVI